LNTLLRIYWRVVGVADELNVQYFGLSLSFGLSSLGVLTIKVYIAAANEPASNLATNMSSLLRKSGNLVTLLPGLKARIVHEQKKS
jgi:hypothetical protein